MKKPVYTFKYVTSPVGVPYDTDKEIDPKKYKFNVWKVTYVNGKQHDMQKLAKYKRLDFHVAEEVAFRLERNLPIPENLGELFFT
jgi:hypothetical protein